VASICHNSYSVKCANPDRFNVRFHSFPTSVTCDLATGLGDKYSELPLSSIRKTSASRAQSVIRVFAMSKARRNQFKDYDISSWRSLP